MKYIFLLFFALVIAATARAGQPWFFGAGEAVNLTNGTAFQNGVKNIAGSLDPSSVAVSAPSGSMYFSTSGTIYVKQDAGLTTNWLPLGIATTGSLTTINGQSGPNVNIAAGSSGTDFNVAAAANTITLNIPTASASNRGLLSSADYSAFLAKQDAITGAASTVVTSNLTANRAVISNGSGKIAASSVTDTELGYIGGVTSAIQTQIDGKEPTITATTSADYYRGDKTFQPLNKVAVGLANVDNTSDANKPVSTATQTALDLKEDLSNKSTSTSLGTSNTLYPSQNAVKSYVDTSIATREPTITTLPLSKGGTNNNITAVNGAVAYSDADSLELTSAGTSGQFLKSNGSSAPSFSSVDLATSSVTGVLPIANGGTSASSFTANYVLLGNGASSFQTVAPGTAGNMLVSTGSTWQSSSVSGSSLITTPGETKAVFVSAKVSNAGVVSDDLGNFINGNCTNANPFVCTFTGSYFATVTCTVSAADASSNNTIQISAQSTSSISVTTAGNGTTSQRAFNVHCHGITP